MSDQIPLSTTVFTDKSTVIYSQIRGSLDPHRSAHPFFCSSPTCSTHRHINHTTWHL